jgi:hypothetical protein
MAVEDGEERVVWRRRDCGGDMSVFHAVA